MRSATRFFLVCLVSLPCLRLYAVGPDYASFLPEVDRVGRVYPNNAAGNAYRVGEFYVLSEAIEQLSGQRDPRNMPPAVAAKYEAYQQEIAKANLSPQKAAQFRVYGMDTEVRRQVLPQYFPPAVLDELGVGLQRGPRTAPPGTAQRNNLPYGGAGQYSRGNGNTYPQSTNPYLYGRPVQGPQYTPAARLILFFFNLFKSVVTIVVFGVVPLILLGVWIYHKIIYGRPYWVPRSNKEALKAFGADAATREKAMLKAFETGDYIFQFIGTTWSNKSRRMRFELNRQVRSFRRGDLESMRVGYLAYNRGKINEETFHAFRFTGIFGDGMTDPTRCDYVGWWAKFKQKWREKFKGNQGQFSLGRSVVQEFAGPNILPRMESAAMALLFKLVQENPNDTLFRDMQTRFYEGIYWLGKNDIPNSAFAPKSPYRISFGILQGTDAELTYSDEGSIFTLAPMRSGKTQCCVFPNLFRLPGPAVVLDVKGEIYEKTARWRSEKVGPVIKFSPLDPTTSACWNPLTQVRREAEYVWEDARFLADMMIVPNPKANDPFWDNRARDLVQAIVADLAFWNPPEERPLSKLMAVINRVGWKEFVERLQENPEVEDMRQEGSSWTSPDPKTFDGILQTAKSSLSAWTGERIKQATRKSDWNPIDLRNGKNLTVYICLTPDKVDSYISLMRVFIAQHIRGLTAQLPPRGAPPILFMLDELPRLRRMPPVQEALEIGGQYGLRLWMFAQYMGQMKEAYGDSAEGMIGSCAVRTYMNPRQEDGTAKALSEQIGLREGEQHGGKGYGVTEANKYIVSPQDLAGPAFKETQIVIGGNSKPAKVHKVYQWQIEEYIAKMNAEKRVSVPQASGTQVGPG